MDSTTIASVLWRRLDVPGHDACRLERTEAGWILDGAAVFREDDSPARLSYRLWCDTRWRTREGDVYGWIGGRRVDFMIRHASDGTWTVNGETVHGMDECVDLDFGFTPATNLSQLRRTDLREGQSADVPVAWFDVAAGTLSLLRQRYERRAEDSYWYEAPRFKYAALLTVDPLGFVRQYPDLWEAV